MRRQESTLPTPTPEHIFPLFQRHSYFSWRSHTVNSGSLICFSATKEDTNTAIATMCLPTDAAPKKYPATTDVSLSAKTQNVSSRNPIQRTASKLPHTNVRSRYLQRLGIASPSKKRATVHPIVSKDRHVPNRILTERLKRDNGEIDQNKNMDEFVPIGRVVRFHSCVTVRPIPSHQQYSERVRRQLWSDRSEMHRSVSRNTLEFAAEHWDWRQAAEEKDMIWCNGQFIHPVHAIKRPCNLQRQFLMVRKQQQQQCSY